MRIVGIIRLILNKKKESGACKDTGGSDHGVRKDSGTLEKGKRETVEERW